jgi:hypothetical protein
LVKIFAESVQDFSGSPYTPTPRLDGVGMSKSCTKVEKNIYVEQRGDSYRYIVAVHPLPRDTATFSTKAEGLAWARRRRVELLEQKAGGQHTARTFTPRPLRAYPHNAGTGNHPNTISVDEILRMYEQIDLPRHSGKNQEISRIRKLKEWFGHFILEELDDSVMETWCTKRLEGLLGSGRNPNRGNSPASDGCAASLTKHQRYWRKKLEKIMP